MVVYGDVLVKGMITGRKQVSNRSSNPSTCGYSGFSEADGELSVPSCGRV